MTNTPLMLLSDSYKVTHHKMLQDGITGLHSYFEARSGATHEKVMFFGLQALLLEHLVGAVVTNEQIDYASEVATNHLGPDLPS